MPHERELKKSIISTCATIALKILIGNKTKITEKSDKITMLFKSVNNLKNPSIIGS